MTETTNARRCEVATRFFKKCKPVAYAPTGLYTCAETQEREDVNIRARRESNCEGCNVKYSNHDMAIPAFDALMLGLLADEAKKRGMYFSMMANSLFGPNFKITIIAGGPHIIRESPNLYDVIESYLNHLDKQEKPAKVKVALPDGRTFEIEGRVVE